MAVVQFCNFLQFSLNRRCCFIFHQSGKQSKQSIRPIEEKGNKLQSESFASYRIELEIVRPTIAEYKIVALRNRSRRA